MRSDVREQLLQVNRAFYQTLGEAYADTRPKPQPGVQRVVDRINTDATVLDVGCGHGLVAEALSRAGFRGRYLGVDSSEPLLSRARQQALAPWADFRLADVSHPDWRRHAELVPDAFDWVLAFAVLHHLPGEALRLRFASDLGVCLRPSGMAAVSAWDFTRSARLRQRVVDWSAIGLAASDLDPGDALLDWRSGGYGLRYVHHFTPDKLTDLAQRAGLEVAETYRRDGEDGQLGLYQIWRRAAVSPGDVVKSALRERRV
ncbi:MAG TPA: class I SAM-dependent methyltransferase [Anaerolineales bacterium]|nr:class I SAM-dependent methyltransferase [Anaerolineales bacterium]